MVPSLIQMRLIRPGLKQGQQRVQRCLNITSKAEFQFASPPEALRTNVDLRNSCLAGVELNVGKVCSEHEERIAGHHRLVARGETDETGHADIVWIIVLDMLLAAQGVNNGCLERLGECKKLFVSPRAAGAA